MSDTRIDREFRRVTAALAGAAPEAPSLESKRRAWTTRPAVLGFGLALLAGVVAVSAFRGGEPSPVGASDTTTTLEPTTTRATTTTSTTTTIPVTVTDPVIHVSGSTTRYSTTGEILVEGFVDQKAQVTVGGIDAVEQVDPDGRTSFWAESSLEPGEHEIEVLAVADAGGAAVVRLTIVVDPSLEEVFGYLGAIDAASLTMAVDTAEWLTGADAVAAAKADGVIPADQDYVDGDFYIRNLVADARILPLAEDPVIVLQACWEVGPCVSTEQVDLATWQLLLADPESGYDTVGWWWYGTGTLPYSFTIRDGVVVQVVEFYLP